MVAARASSSSSSRVEDENDDFAMKKTRRDTKERTMEPSSSQTFCAVSRCSASREAHATTNGDSIRENIFFIQFARTVRSCTNHATFRVDECDDDQRCAISAQYGDVYLARDDDVSLHRFLVVSRTKKKRRRKRRKRRRFEDEGENSGTKGESKFTEEERGEMHGKVSREEEEGGEGVVDLACVFIQ